MLQETSNDPTLVAAQLAEAAYRAREGDREATQALIARAIALLNGDPSAIPKGGRPPERASRERVRGGLVAWQKRRLVAHIDAHIDRRIWIKELAQLMSLSEGYFGRAFRSAFGTSAHDYLTRRRIEMAQGLMLTTGESLSAIALRCGLSDQSHFTRMFRRIVGETPSAWRRTRQAEIEDRTTARLSDSAGSPRRSVLQGSPWRQD
jgi:AraC-like DNA-binding protein